MAGSGRGRVGGWDGRKGTSAQWTLTRLPVGTTGIPRLAHPAPNALRSSINPTVAPLSRHGCPWTDEDHVLAFHLYCQFPFGKMHKGNPQIIKLAQLLERTPDSVAMKLSNFARWDPALQARGIGGLSQGAKGEKDVWDKFAADPETFAFQSEKVLAARRGITVEDGAGIQQEDLPPPGVERDAVVRVRVNQSFFRRRIISAYDFQCCVTGLAVPDLLVASHISPWARDGANRLNPKNGLCLNALHDKAFDRGLMWIDDDFRIRFAETHHPTRPQSADALSWVIQFAGQPLRLPLHFEPDRDLLRQHREAAQQRRSHLR